MIKRDAVTLGKSMNWENSTLLEIIITIQILIDTWRRLIWPVEILYNYPPKGRWIVVDIYRDSKRQGIYPPLFTDPEGDSCFSI